MILTPGSFAGISGLFIRLHLAQMVTSSSLAQLIKRPLYGIKARFSTRDHPTHKRLLLLMERQPTPPQDVGQKSYGPKSSRKPDALKHLSTTYLSFPRRVRLWSLTNAIL